MTANLPPLTPEEREMMHRLAVINRRTDVLRLLAERDALAAEVERLRVLWEGDPVRAAQRARDEAIDVARKLAAEVERLRAELSEPCGRYHETYAAGRREAFEEAARDMDEHHRVIREAIASGKENPATALLAEASALQFADLFRLRAIAAAKPEDE